jgi:hypothetical protein
MYSVVSAGFHVVHLLICVLEKGWYKLQTDCRIQSLCIAGKKHRGLTEIPGTDIRGRVECHYTLQIVWAYRNARYLHALAPVRHIRRACVRPSGGLQGHRKSNDPHRSVDVLESYIHYLQFIIALFVIVQFSFAA